LNHHHHYYILIIVIAIVIIYYYSETKSHLQHTLGVVVETQVGARETAKKLQAQTSQLEGKLEHRAL
jgi:hypothetical protein